MSNKSDNAMEKMSNKIDKNTNRKAKSNDNKNTLLDISGYTIFDVENRRDKEITKDYIRLIQRKDVMLFDDYIHKDEFIYMADILKDDEVDKKTQKQKRQTVIRFVPLSSFKKQWKQNQEVLYIFTINDYIVKIGGSSNGMSERTASYLCGHHAPQRGKSGKASETNIFIYNTFDFYIRNGVSIKVYVKVLDEVKHTINPFNTKYSYCSKPVEINLQTYQAYESMYIDDFRKHNNKKAPPLSYNSDPTYKKSDKITSCNEKKCPPNKICNPQTLRCITEDGKKAKELNLK